MKRYTDPGTAIQAVVGEEFAIELAGNPTTGYTWQVQVDSQYLELHSQTFEPGGEGIGAGGMEVLRFRVLAAGETEIACGYQRPWEEEVLESRRFQVSASG